MIEEVAAIFVERATKNRTIAWSNHTTLVFDHDVCLYGTMHVLNHVADWAFYYQACDMFGKLEFKEAVKTALREKYEL